MIESILSITENLNRLYGYPVLCVCAFIENIVPPIPGDTVIIFGGYLTGIGRFNIIGVVLSTTVGSFAGFMVIFFLGRLLGKKFSLDKNVCFFSRNNFLKVSGWFEKYGYAVVLGNRFLSGARSVISLCAGITNLHASKVALYSFVSCFVWNLMLVTAGYKVGENWEIISEFLKKYNIIVLCVLILLLIGVVIKKMNKKNSA